MFEWNEWNPAWYARPEGEFVREGTPPYIWMKIWKFWKILWKFGKNMYIAKSMRFESINVELLPFYSIQRYVPFFLQLWPIKNLTYWEVSLILFPKHNGRKLGKIHWVLPFSLQLRLKFREKKSIWFSDRNTKTHCILWSIQFIAKS